MRRRAKQSRRLGQVLLLHGMVRADETSWLGLRATKLVTLGGLIILLGVLNVVKSESLRLGLLVLQGQKLLAGCRGDQRC